MNRKNLSRASILLAGTIGVGLLVSAILLIALSRPAVASPRNFRFQPCEGNACDWDPRQSAQFGGESAGTWYWVRSPEQERRMVMGLYNQYCIRCHGVDGRGVWDIPDVPNFTNVRWQQCRSDAQLARIILEGRGACMPPFRGALSLEEAWAVARYLRTFVPGTEASRPNLELPALPAVEAPPALPSASTRRPAK